MEQVSDKMKRLNDFVAELKTMDVAINTRDANEQHYEVTADFFQVMRVLLMTHYLYLLLIIKTCITIRFV